MIVPRGAIWHGRIPRKTAVDLVTVSEMISTFARRTARH